MPAEKKRAPAIGRVKCPWCASPKARVSLTVSGMCCVTCNCCHSQTFARSAYSDTMIRQVMTPELPAPPDAGEKAIVIGQEAAEKAIKPAAIAPEAKTEEPAKPANDTTKAYGGFGW